MQSLTGAGAALRLSIAHKTLFVILALLFIPVRGATVAADSLFSPRLQRAIQYQVGVPSAYNRAGNESRHFPVVFFLHCAGCEGPQWLSDKMYCGDLGGMLDQWEIIAVAPDDGQVLSWWLDSPQSGQDQMSSFLALDLVAHIDSLYRINPLQRGLSGHSMGGFGALHNLLYHPQVFSAAFSIKGAVDILPYPNNWGLPQLLNSQSTHLANWQAANVASNARLFAQIQPAPAIGFYSGSADWFHMDNNRFADSLLAYGVAFTHMNAPAGEQHYPLDPQQMQRVMAFFGEAFGLTSSQNRVPIPTPGRGGAAPQRKVHLNGRKLHPQNTEPGELRNSFTPSAKSGVDR